MDNLNALLEKARYYVMSKKDWEEQRRSFACGNGAIENSDITRDSIDRVADKMRYSDR